MHRNEVTVNNIVNVAEQALKKPDYFMYFGRDEMFNTWGFSGIDLNATSDLLEQSNFEVITKDLMSKHPDDFEIEEYKHWAVGWVKRLTCRILEKDDEITRSNITEAFKAAIEWHESLNLYPIADENHFSDLETKTAIEDIEEYYDIYQYVNTNIDGWAESIYWELVNMGVEIFPGSSSPTDSELMQAIYNQQLWDPENIDIWEEFCNNNNLQFPMKKHNPNQLNLFED